VREFLFKGGAVVGNGSISQVRPEDKMAADLQNGGIIVLLVSTTSEIISDGEMDIDKIGHALTVEVIQVSGIHNTHYLNISLETS
jgi:hypothetical protein